MNDMNNQMNPNELKSDERRLKYIGISPKVLGDFCRTTEFGHAFRITGVPRTARFIYAFFDPQWQRFVCVFEDESFEPIGNHEIQAFDYIPYVETVLFESKKVKF